jgi:hypothetical protein
MRLRVVATDPSPSPITARRQREPLSLLPRSWNIPRAIKYREINKITGLRGTAVNIQTMGKRMGNFRPGKPQS